MNGILFKQDVLRHVCGRRHALRLFVLILAFAWGYLGLSSNRFSTASGAGWYDSNWQCRKRMTIDASKVTVDLSNFPVLVSLSSDTDLAAKAQDNGNDILFTASDGTTKLDHEIEKFDGSTGELVAWVKVTSLSASINTYIYMYYDNPSATNQQNASGVWDSNFKMVQHLQETSGAHYDSSSNNNDGAPFSGVNQNVGGQIGGADDFDGSSGYVQVNSGLNFTGDFTLECWLYKEGGWTLFMIEKASCYYLKLDTTYPVFYIAGVGTLTATSPISGNAWQHVAAVFTRGSPNAWKIYINGQEKGSDSGWGTPGSSSSQLYLGCYQGASNYFNGKLDEFRFSNVARSAGWIETSYNNQSDPSSFVAMGSEEPLYVRLESFTAIGANGQVNLYWSTASEFDSAGFNILRCDTFGGRFKAVNQALIPARGNSFAGANYTYVDYDVVNGSVYGYMLEEIETDGDANFHGPVRASPGIVSLFKPMDGGHVSLSAPRFEITASPDIKRLALYISPYETLKGKATIRMRVSRRRPSGPTDWGYRAKLGKRARKRLAKLASKNGWTLYCGVYGAFKGERHLKRLSNVNRFSVVVAGTDSDRRTQVELAD